MSKSKALRDLVMERLVVAADEIFALFERTIAEYEEEALRSRLQLQEPRVELHQEEVQTFSVSVEVDPSPEHIIKEQLLCVKQEEEPPLELLFGPVSVKTEDNIDEGSLLQQEQTEEIKEDTVGEQCEEEEPGCSLDLPSDNNEQTYSCSDTDDSEDWEPSAKRSSKLNGQGSNSVHRKNFFTTKPTFSDRNCNTAINNGFDDGESKSKQHTCYECGEAFQTEAHLQKHLCIHSEQSPFNYPVIIADKEEKPFSCSVCNKCFIHKRNLKAHMRIHTGEKPFSCSDCGLRFRFRQNLFQHVLAVHRREKPYSCPVCKKGFAHKSDLMLHKSIHVEEKSFSCAVCNKVFSCKRNLTRHMTTHLRSRMSSNTTTPSKKLGRPVKCK